MLHNLNLRLSSEISYMLVKLLHFSGDNTTLWCQFFPFTLFEFQKLIKRDTSLIKGSTTHWVISVTQERLLRAGRLCYCESRTTYYIKIDSIEQHITLRYILSDIQKYKFRMEKNSITSENTRSCIQHKQNPSVQTNSINSILQNCNHCCTNPVS